MEDSSLALLYPSFSESLALRAVSSALWGGGPLSAFPHVIHTFAQTTITPTLTHSHLFTTCYPGHCSLSVWDSRTLRSDVVI